MFLGNVLIKLRETTALNDLNAKSIFMYFRRRRILWETWQLESLDEY